MRGTSSRLQRRLTRACVRAWMRARIQASAWAVSVASVLRTIAGAPDYERYVGHLRTHHPRATPLTRDEFTRERLAHRYNRPGSRCC